MAGLASDVSQPEHYQAGVVPVSDLLAGLPRAFEQTHSVQLLAEQVAQIDSKDMDDAVWRALSERLLHWLAQDDVQGVVVTHGSDTLEETACFLQAVFNPVKPLVLTCAMRPANVPQSDGPTNLHDALLVAMREDLHGVLTVCGGSIHAGLGVQKIQSHDLRPFVSQSGPVGRVQEGQFLDFQCVPPAKFDWPMPSPEEVLQTAIWPRVELVFNHAGANGNNVREMMQSRQPPQGFVVAGTGNGTVNKALEDALKEAQAKGVQVVRTTRCALGTVSALPGDGLSAVSNLTPAQARVSLQMGLLKRGWKKT